MAANNSRHTVDYTELYISKQHIKQEYLLIAPPTVLLPEFF